MIYYLLINADGRIIQRGGCMDEDGIPPMPGCRHEIIEHDDPRQPWQGPDPTYREFRAMRYPPVGDQLDALWKLFEAISPESAPQAEMLERIKAIKAEFPKL